MQDDQREGNPDVNTYIPGSSDTGGEDPNEPDRDSGTSNIEDTPDDDLIPLPPDAEPAVPLEAPPGRESPPMGDVDDSPKRIVSD